MQRSFYKQENYQSITDCLNQTSKDSLNSIGNWLAREEALLDGIEAKHGGILPHVLSSSGTTVSKPFNSSTTVNDAVVAHQQSITHMNTSINELRPTSEIPKPFDSIFKFGLFNIIQSKCLADIFYEDNNLVFSAPTGSGKTVFMELAIIRTLLHSGSNSKVIYMAPTKSLCSERAKDWQLKFKPLGIECGEFTGDTQRSSISAIRKTTIIITTPEKWDSMTRRWNDHKQLMKLINLFLIDEVHILNERRGACLEACVSRMQTMDINLRYIAVSATVPNLEDIATWLHAKPIAFSEEYRPIKLERFVYGYPYREGNMFLFDRNLDWKLLDMIEKHSDRKPVLVFCSTRKSAEQACFTIAKLMDKKGISTLSNSGPSAQSSIRFKNKNLLKFIKRGVAFHHAGLDPSDRFQVENQFMNRDIRVIATTSTLAVGVNLPAHLVVIKSTQGYQNGSLDEYSDIDLLQMMGRAGRPGLDTSGCVVILTTLGMELRYKSLVSGTTHLESRLHENLIEHLASEICLGTITNQVTALKWLQSTFLYVRLLKNPVHYKLNHESISSSTILQEICSKNLELLERHNLIQKAADLTLKATEYGYAMDIYYIRFPTMVQLMESKTPTSIKETLELISRSHEEMDTIRFNQGDKQFLNSISNHDNIRFPIERIASISDKVFMMIQCILGDISMNNSNGGNTLLAIEGAAIMKHSSRIARCLIDCSIQEKNAAKLKYALELYQCLQAHMWSNSPYNARQLPGIGSQYAKTIAQANLINFDQLRDCDPGRFEQLLHRNPPFGIKLCKEISILPHLSLDIHQLKPSKSETNTETGNVEISVHLVISLINRNVIARSIKGKCCYVQFWMATSDNRLVDFRRTLVSNLLDQKYEFDIIVEIESTTSTINAHLQCGDYVGLDIHKEFKPKVDPRKFISITGASNISKPQVPPDRNELQAKSSYSVQENDPLELVDDDVEMQEVFKMPSPKPAPPVMTTSVNTQMDVDEIEALDGNMNSHMYNDLFREISNIEAGPSISFESTEFKKVQEKESVEKNKSKKKLSLPSVPCKHLCKNKDRCRHKCCKRFIDNDAPTFRAGIKRPSPENHNILPQKERKLESIRIKTPEPQSEPEPEPQPQPAESVQRDLFEFFPQLSEKDVEVLGNLDESINSGNTAVNEGIVDQSIIDDIDNDSMANDDFDVLLADTATVCLSSRPLNTMTCDELWDEVGKIAHLAFSSLNINEDDSHDLRTGQLQPDYSVDTTNSDHSTLKGWIEKNIIIVYN